MFDLLINTTLTQEDKEKVEEFKRKIEVLNKDELSLIIFNSLNEKLNSEKLVRQFILEELDAARQGDDRANNFVLNSGFQSFEYVGAMNRTQWEGNIDELEYLQIYFRGFLFKIPNIKLQTYISLFVVDKIMQQYKLGKYKV